MIFPPIFKFLLSNERLDIFVIKNKIERINNADQFWLYLTTDIKRPLTSQLMSLLLKGHTIMTKLTIRLILACSLKHFPPSFVLLLPLLHQLTADDFSTFFINKMTNLTTQFSTPQSVKHILPANINSFTYFSPLSEAEISKLILSSHPTTCTLDPIPFHLLQSISPAVVPALTHIVNTSLYTGIFPSVFK